MIATDVDRRAGAGAPVARQLRILRRREAGRLATCASSRPTTRRRSSSTSSATTPLRRWRSSGCACRGSPAAANCRQDLSLLRQRERRVGGRCRRHLRHEPGAGLSLRRRSRLRRRMRPRIAASRRSFQAEVNPRLADRRRRALQRHQLDHHSRRGRAAVAARQGHDAVRLGAHRAAADAGVRRLARQRSARAHARRRWRAAVRGTRRARSADTARSAPHRCVPGRMASPRAASRRGKARAAGRRGRGGSAAVGERAADRRHAHRRRLAAQPELFHRRARRAAGVEHRAQRRTGCTPRPTNQGMVAPLVVYGGDAQKEAAEQRRLSIRPRCAT